METTQNRLRAKSSADHPLDSIVVFKVKYLLSTCSDILQAPKMCAVVHISLLHKVQIASVVSLHLLRLAGDGRVSNVQAEQNGIRLAGIANKVAQEKSCWI